MTQRELADKAGTTQSAIARLESGRTSPSLEDVQRLMRLAGFELIVELAPFDDSDRVQAAALLRLTVEERITSNTRVVKQAAAFRRAMKEATHA
ncbi:MAG: helix-turn-helix domain-containing protein [Actinomycetota bacterium]|nr:helix-turn-helix domain-containing protein [Actinomycetota bacterium]